MDGNIERVAMQPVQHVATTTRIDLLTGEDTGGTSTAGAAMALAPPALTSNDEPAYPNAKTRESL